MGELFLYPWELSKEYFLLHIHIYIYRHIYKLKLIQISNFKDSSRFI